MIDTAEAAARALYLLQRAAASTDAREHARLFSDAVAAVLDQPGELSAEDRDALFEAGKHAVERTSTLDYGLSTIRLHLGSIGAGYQIFTWSLPAADREMREAEARGRNMRDYAEIFRNDLDTAARICALQSRVDETKAEGSGFVLDDSGLPQIEVAAPPPPVRLH